MKNKDYYPCIDGSVYVPDSGGCTMPSIDRVYACDLYRHREDTKKTDVSPADQKYQI